jgi:hypothetical protein
MNRTFVAIGAILLVAAVLWAAVISQSGDDEPAMEVAAEPPAEPTAAAPKPTTPGPGPAPAQDPVAKAPAQAQPTSPAKSPDKPAEGETPPSENRVPVPENVGNLAELKGRFEKEPRDSAAPEDEAKIQAAFRAEGMPQGLLASALCRQTVCRAVFRWTPERAEGYMGGMMGLSDKFAMENMAVDEGTPDAQEGRTIEVFFERKR